jgi:hypothetical protein
LNKFQPRPSDLATVNNTGMKRKANMKKTLIALGLTAAFVGAQVKTAAAHDRGCNPVGAVIGGIVAGAIIADALTPRPVYVSAPAPAYYPPRQPVVYAPAPVVYAQPQVVYAPAPPIFVYREPFMRVGFGWGWPHRRGEWRGHEHGHRW